MFKEDIERRIKKKNAGKSINVQYAISSYLRQFVFSIAEESRNKVKCGTTEVKKSVMCGYVTD